jgi:heme/copper-type cytochrome/quinol oxidase subunit 2
MAGYLSLVSETAGMPIWLLTIIVIWTLCWKLIAMYKAAQKKSVIWFIVLALINTMGILPIFYIFLFSKMKIRIQELPLKKKKKKFSRKK